MLVLNMFCYIVMTKTNLYRSEPGSCCWWSLWWFGSLSCGWNTHLPLQVSGQAQKPDYIHKIEIEYSRFFTEQMFWILLIFDIDSCTTNLNRCHNNHIVCVCFRRKKLADRSGSMYERFDEPEASNWGQEHLDACVCGELMLCILFAFWTWISPFFHLETSGFQDKVFW